MYPDIEKLLQIWESAISEWRSSKNSIYKYATAERAMSSGAYFEDAYKSDEILRTIHYNFGLLEATGPDDDPDNNKLWAEQAKLVSQARAKYLE